MGKDKAPDKTNVMRLLDQAGIDCVQRFYDPDETAGEAVAALLGYSWFDWIGSCSYSRSGCKY